MEMKFSGTLVFDREESLAAAVADADEQVDGFDADLRRILAEEAAVVVDGLWARVEINLSGPSDWWFCLEGLVEAYADRAVRGRVDCWCDEELAEPYGPNLTH